MVRLITFLRHNAFLLLIMVIHPTLINASASDIRLLQSDASGVIVEYIPSYHQPSKVIIDGNEYLRYDFNSSIVYELQNPGSPEMKICSVLLRFMGVNDNNVEVLKIEYEDIPNVLLAPAPAVHETEIGVAQIFVVDPVAFANAEFLPQQITWLANIGETRGAVLGDLRISPLQYNAALRILRKYNRIVVRVNFGKPERPVVQADNLVKGLALNDDAFKEYRPQALNFKKGGRRNSVLSAGNWFRFYITENGMYKLTGQQLLDAGVPSSTNPGTVKIFNNGGSEIPTTDDLLENAVYVNDGGTTAQLDPEDYIIFYGKGTRGWTYGPSTKSFRHYLNHFTEANVYWLTYGSSFNKAMTEIPSLNTSTPFRPSTVVSKVFREDEMVNILSSGQQWLGQSFNVGNQMTYVHSLPGIDVTQPIKYTFHLGARSSGPSTFTIQEHNTQILTIPIRAVGSEYDRQFEDALKSESKIPDFSNGQSQLRFTFTSSSSSGIGYLDWYEILYPRFLNAQSDQINFHTSDTDTVAEYVISGFSGGSVFVFDVTQFDNVRYITNLSLTAGTCTFQYQLNAGSVKELYVVGPKGFNTPGSLAHVSNQNLHGDSNEADYIIVTHPEFMPAAQRLKTYREQQGHNALTTLVVNVDQIYNEFSGGLLTPVAIRNYLHYDSTNWSKPPKYVLLFGDGDYDYKRIIGTGPNWIPPWETSESFLPLSSYASDDDFAIFNDSGRVGVGLGRLTARSLKEANLMVDKIIEYETKSVPDPWKLRVTLVADDGLAAPGVDDGFVHTDQAESVGVRVPPLFEKRKIYLYDYPITYAAGGRRKPGVNLALQDQINQGTLVLNYTGHGNQHLWAHEAIFVAETDFPLLHNKGKYFFLVAATCNFSVFDLLNEQSGSEQLVAMADGGAIGVFSATRAVFSFENFLLNETLYRNLFDTAGGRILPKRLGDVVYRTKQSHTSENDRKYILLGDPALQIAFPKMYASVDSINHAPSNQTSQLQAKSHASVVASVRDSAAALDSNFYGQAQIVVYDADRSVEIDDPINGRHMYKATGSVLFRGVVSVTKGDIGSQFIVPKDISNSDDFGRITIYFWNSVTDGTGYAWNFRVNGTDTLAPPDVKGPQIQLYFDDKKNFRPGDVVSVSPTLYADLFDSSGINTSGSGIGHRLEAWLDGQAQSIDLSNDYLSNQDTYQEGTIKHPLGTLTQGTHRLRLRAWDTYNNSSTEETMFDAGASVGLKLLHVFNYPNPFSSETYFTFEHNQISALDVEVKIYTIAGRLIQSIKKTNVANQFVQIKWDGRDKDGDILANGVYLYKVIAKTQDGRFASEELGKLSILK